MSPSPNPSLPPPGVHSRGEVERDSKQPKALAGKLSACWVLMVPVRTVSR